MIGIIGAGNMGKAIAARLGRGVLISDVDRKKLRSVKKRSIKVAKDNVDLVKRSEEIILAVKPQSILSVLQEIRPYVKNKVIISIAAGIEVKFIEKALGKVRVVRVMPNMPAMAGKGISAISKGRYAKKKDLETVKKIFLKVGEVVIVKENLMHAVTALSGSGPAYYFLFTGLLEKAGISCGLKKELARKLALATFVGAGEVALKSNISMQDFVKKVASKGGTTEAALQVFKKKGLERTVKLALRSAYNRSKTLSK